MEKLTSAPIEVIPDQLNLGDTHRKQRRDQSDEAVPDRAISQVDVEAGHKHKCNRNRQALVGEMRAEHGARQYKVRIRADGEYGPAGRIEFQDSAPESIGRTRCGRCDQDSGYRQIVDIEHDEETLQLATSLTKRQRARGIPGRAGDKEYDERHERNAGRDKLGEARCPGLVSSQPQTMQVERQQSKAVNASSKQMAEEQHKCESG